MKRIFAILLSTVLVLSLLCSCGNSNTVTPNPESSQTKDETVQVSNDTNIEDKESSIEGEEVNVKEQESSVEDDVLEEDSDTNNYYDINNLEYEKISVWELKETPKFNIKDFYKNNLGEKVRVDSYEKVFKRAKDFGVSPDEYVNAALDIPFVKQLDTEKNKEIFLDCVADNINYYTEYACVDGYDNNYDVEPSNTYGYFNVEHSTQYGVNFQYIPYQSTSITFNYNYVNLEYAAINNIQLEVYNFFSNIVGESAAEYLVYGIPQGEYDEFYIENKGPYFISESYEDLNGSIELSRDITVVEDFGEDLLNIEYNITILSDLCSSDELNDSVMNDYFSHIYNYFTENGKLNNINQTIKDHVENYDMYVIDLDNRQNYLNNVLYFTDSDENSNELIPFSISVYDINKPERNYTIHAGTYTTNYELDMYVYGDYATLGVISDFEGINSNKIENLLSDTLKILNDAYPSLNNKDIFDSISADKIISDLENNDKYYETFNPTEKLEINGVHYNVEYNIQLSDYGTDSIRYTFTIKVSK